MSGKKWKDYRDSQREILQDLVMNFTWAMVEKVLRVTPCVFLTLPATGQCLPCTEVRADGRGSSSKAVS